MKIILLLIAFGSAFFFGCNYYSSKTSVQGFIPGTYYSNWQGEYSETKDTLLIEPLTKEGSATYAITRRVFIHYASAAGKRPPEYKIVHWTATYDTDAKTIIVNNNGRVLSFDLASKEMIMGITRYKKL